MFDGTLTIDTELNTKAFDQGIKSLVSGLKGLATTAAAVLLGLLGIQSVKSLAILSAEFGRLKQAAQAIGQMYGFTAERARKVIDSLVEQGIQTDVASRAYINFVKEGLDANLLPGLARGAQNLNALADAGESSSDVLNGLLGGILTLNTQVLRNRGVVVDLTSAYKNYAETMGITAGQLTITEQRQALLIAVTEKLKGVTGLYELSQRTAAGQMSSNLRIMNEFKNVLGGALQDAFFNLIKSFNDLIKGFTIAFREGGRLHSLWLTLAGVASLLSRAIRAMFEAMALWLGLQPSKAKAVTGGLEGMADGADAAATAEDNLSDSLDNANKAAKGALTAFDELNVLQQPDAGAGAEVPGLDLQEMADVDLGLIEDPLIQIQDVADQLFVRFQTLFEPLLSALDKLKIALEPLGQTIWAGLMWAYDNILVPLGEWVASEFLPVFLEAIGAAALLLNTVLIALEPLWMWFWDNVLKPLAVWVGGKLVEYLEWVTDNLKKMTEWIENNQEAFQVLAVVIGVLLTIFLIIISPLAQFIAILIAIGVVVWALIEVWPFLVKAVQAAWDFIVAYAQWAWNNLKSIIAIFGAYFAWAWGNLKAIVKFILEAIVAYATWAWNNLTKGVEFLGTVFENVFTGVKNFIKGVVNGIIDIINGMVSHVINGINTIVGAANLVGELIPNYESIPLLDAPQIPHLARGAVIPPNDAFTAILGDQSSGRNIEAPESLIRQIVSEEIGNIQADIKIEFGGSLSELVRQLKPFIDKENVRVGGSLIKSGTTV